MRFLCETIHPVVRTNDAECAMLQNKYNEFLNVDSVELYIEKKISEKNIYAPRPVQYGLDNIKVHLAESVSIFETDYIKKQISILNAAILENPGLAIGTSKELIETICKTILDEK